ncbi:MAG TPA: AraC family transcriptional regulator [Polyangiaceae bacterium]
MHLPPVVTLERLGRTRDQIHGALQEGVSVAELAQQAGMSPSYFLRAFREVFGDTPHAYLLELRLERTPSAGAGKLDHRSLLRERLLECRFVLRAVARGFGVSPKYRRQRVRCLVQAPELWPAIWAA